ncbi:MAG: hypothetical protein AB8B80_05240 [Marinicellaceae bacterium]
MRILYLALTLLASSACSQHTINKTQGLSQLNTEIQFSSSKKPYLAFEQVGGEQINSTTIHAKKGDMYLIEILSSSESLKFYIDGTSEDGQVIDKNPIKRKVTALSNTEIQLLFTSHPDASDYELKISKL